MQGNIQGGGIERSQVPLESCKRKCDRNAKCKAFQFEDEINSECVLFRESKPTGPRMDGFKFCKKLGTYQVIIKFQVIYHVRTLIPTFGIYIVSVSLFYSQSASPFLKYQKIVTVVVLIMVDVIRICCQSKFIATQIMDVVALQVVTLMHRWTRINMTGSPWIAKV